MTRGPEQEPKGKPRAGENVASEQLQKVLSAQHALFERVRYQIGVEVDDLLAQFPPSSRTLTSAAVASVRSDDSNYSAAGPVSLDEKASSEA